MTVVTRGAASCNQSRTSADTPVSETSVILSQSRTSAAIWTVGIVTTGELPPALRVPTPLMVPDASDARALVVAMAPVAARVDDPCDAR